MNELTHYVAPIVAIVGYINYPTNLRIHKDLLRTLSVAHNTALVVFSSWTFASMCQILYNRGIVFQSNYYFSDATFDKIIYYFYLSKYYEFIDTFLLYLSGKTPIFLQKYHHIGAVVCWHLSYIYKVDSIWIGTILNSLVHIIMYSYYLGCLLKIQQVRFIKQYITSLQLIQLTVPNFFILYYYSPPVETEINFAIIKIFILYVIGLIILFSQFYYKNYILTNKQV
jgi:hypothetical protein